LLLFSSIAVYAVFSRLQDAPRMSQNCC